MNELALLWAKVLALERRVRALEEEPPQCPSTWQPTRQRCLLRAGHGGYHEGPAICWTFIGDEE